jgi:hypothetical protein
VVVEITLPVCADAKPAMVGWQADDLELHGSNRYDGLNGLYMDKRDASVSIVYAKDEHAHMAATRNAWTRGMNLVSRHGLKWYYCKHAAYIDKPSQRLQQVLGSNDPH